jgi:hypothetical protein
MASSAASSGGGAITGSGGSMTMRPEIKNNLSFRQILGQILVLINPGIGYLRQLKV